MIRSMTGYGRSEQILHGKAIAVEVRSVNHRYFEYTSRLPRSCSFLDDRLKKLVQCSASRGKVDLGLTVTALEGTGAQVAIDHTLAREYLSALQALGRELDLTDDVTVSVLSRFSDIFTVQKTEEDEEQLWADVETVAKDALSRFVEMRQLEGERLREDILGRLLLIEDCVGIIEERSPATVEEYRARLTAKLTELLQGIAPDEQRVITEVALMGEKLAVDEETVRLRSHMGQLRDILGLPEAVGRKLDFLMQELNREINTIGSKAQDVAIARVVVDVKSELEKIREQIQNIE
ncbi:MAG: YicC/YloC family endoribonuclease [Angelakisella sp.]